MTATLVHQRVSEVASRTPRAIAVEGAARAVTYAELERTADAWADALRASGVGIEDRVGVCLPITVETVEIMLAVT